MLTMAWCAGNNDYELLSRNQEVTVSRALEGTSAIGGSAPMARK
jgi:hypothetical protein